MLSEKDLKSLTSIVNQERNGTTLRVQKMQFFMQCGDVFKARDFPIYFPIESFSFSSFIVFLFLTALKSFIY